MLSEALNSYSDFAYTGDTQTCLIPRNGIYHLECWGAGGGKNGGYASGYAKLSAGDTLYVCVGGYGAYGTGKPEGGYNGGGCGAANALARARGGGGATHIAQKDGTLAVLGSADSLYIVAGGAGGSNTYGDIDNNKYLDYKCGAGGGLQGETGVQGYSASQRGWGGTQVSGYAFGQGGDATASGWKKQGAGGGGGGLYGGLGGELDYWHEGGSAGAGGGSGYIGGVPDFTYKGTVYACQTVTGGGESENGRARITLVMETTLPILYNGVALERLIVNGVQVEHALLDGVRIFCERMFCERIKKRGGIRRWLIMQKNRMQSNMKSNLKANTEAMRCMWRWWLRTAVR